MQILFTYVHICEFYLTLLFMKPTGILYAQKCRMHAQKCRTFLRNKSRFHKYIVVVIRTLLIILIGTHINSDLKVTK